MNVVNKNNVHLEFNLKEIFIELYAADGSQNFCNINFLTLNIVFLINYTSFYVY